MGCIRNLTCTPLKRWYGSLCTWDNFVQESQQYQKARAWLNDSRKVPLENQDKMKANHQVGVHLITRDDHENQWRSTNLNQNGNIPQYGIRCVVGQNIIWHQIIHHQVCNLNHPCPQLNRINRSKCLLEEETWWYLNAEKCELDWIAQERLPWEIMIRQQTGHRLGMYLISDEDHVTSWRSTNLNRKGNMPQYGIRCMVDRKIEHPQIIRHQMRDPNHPNPQLNRTHISKGVSQKKKHENI